MNKYFSYKYKATSQRRWTPTAIECYSIGCVCSKCSLYGIIGDKCCMKGAVLELVRRFGIPEGVKSGKR